MEEHFSSLVDYQFTAEMEDYLDQISRNERENLEYLQEFYFGDDGVAEKVAPGGIGLKPLLELKVAEIDPRTACSYPLSSTIEGGEIGVSVRVGRYGPYVEQGERRASIPDEMPPDEMTLVVALEMLAKQEIGDEPLGTHPETLKPIYVKQGRFGPYVQMGEADDEEKKNASLLKGMSPETLDLEMAIKLLSLPRTLGNHPENGEPIIATQGRFGPFIKNGTDSRSLGPDHNLLEITLEQALALLAQPKAQGRGRAAAAPPLKEFDASPVTGNKIVLRDGRYGLYVNDGETNASLPKDMSGEDLTFEQAVDLLAARAAAGGSKKKKSKRAPAKKATKAAKKTSKKATKKKSSADDVEVVVDADLDSMDDAAPTKKVKAAKKTTKKASKKASKKSS
jgi:DNA topoisomerase-1